MSAPWALDELVEPADLAERGLLDDVSLNGDRPRERGVAARVLGRDALRSLPRPEPLIDRTLDLRTVALLAGYWGTCKTFLALDMALSVATGRRWHGRGVEGVRVLYVAAEGAYGIAQRVRAWEDFHAVTVEDARFNVLPEPIALGNRGAVVDLCGVIADGGYGLVVVDTIAKCAVGLDENSAGDMGRVVDALYQIRNSTRDGGNGCVLAVHHTGKDRSTVRGSSVLEAGVDTTYVTEGDARALRFSRTKAKDRPTEDVLSLALEPVEGSGSAVISVRGAADMADSARTLMSAYLSAFETTGASKSELRAVAEMPPATFHRALNALVSGGLLVNEGSDARPFFRQAVES